jgi:hypothetical protein
MTIRRNLDLAEESAKPDLDIVSMFSEREPERYALHSRYMNEMMVRANGVSSFTEGAPLGLPCGGTASSSFPGSRLCVLQ